MWKASFFVVLVILAAYGNASLQKKQVCIIGAGAAGLTAVKYLSEYPEEFEPIAFEKQSDVGGLWIYTDSTTVDEHGLPVHSSVYKNLRINFPKELEAFVDYPEFRGDESQGSFVSHTQMLEYLRNYTDHYNLRPYIKLNTNVEKLIPRVREKWFFVTRDLITKTQKVTICDAAIVGNGNNFKGHMPKLSGMENFHGQVIHSHAYRYPEVFAGQTVLVLGASYSGRDISIDISRFAEKVYLSHRGDKFTFELPRNVEQVLDLVGAQDGELILSDGSRIQANAVVLCTGYDYEYSFLDKNSGIFVDGDGKSVHSVYKHLINIEHPTMAILNLPIPGLPFILAHAQVPYFIAVLRGKIKLPSRSDMLKDATLSQNTTKNKNHDLSLKATMFYYNELALAAEVTPLSDFYLNAVSSFLPLLYSNPLHFREKILHVKNDSSVEFV